MKRILIIMICLFTFTNAMAQISDLDAKLQYKEAEKAYETGDYFNASKICADLKSKMQGWTPLVLYFYLESVYKNYTEKRQKNNLKYPEDFQKYREFKTLNDSLFLMINKATYPSEKYNEMLITQQYFQQMMGKTEYQTKRTPEKALAFLNECAEKFHISDIGSNYYTEADKERLKKNAKILVRHDYGPGSNHLNTLINFTIVDSLLHIRAINFCISPYKRRWNRNYLMYDIIDLIHAPYIDNPTNSNELSYFSFDHQYWSSKHPSFVEKDTLLRKQVGNRLFLGYNKRYDDKYTMEYKPMIYEYVYPFLDFFDKENEEFKTGHYEQRIEEAWRYLLNYYPKEKLKLQPQVKVDEKDKVF